MNIYPYFTLKVSNTVLQLVFGVLTTYVFLRIVPPDVFAAYILTSAIGGYSSLADLGYSNLIYVDMRKANLDGHHLGTALEDALAALLAYGSIVLLVLFVVGALIVANVIENHGAPLNLILYLLFWLLLLPWNIVRTTANAVDLYIRFEIIELIRRLLVTGFLIGLLAGLDIRQYLIAINVVWGARFLVAAFYGRRLFDEFGAGKGSIAAVVTALGTVALVVYLFKLSFPLFLGAYVLVYGIGAILLFWRYLGPGRTKSGQPG